MLKSSPGVERGDTARSAPFDLVKEFDLARRLVDAINAHGPSHPDLRAVGRRAQQMEHLPRIGLQSMLMNSQDQMSVLIVDRTVGHDGRDELADQPLRIVIPVRPPAKRELVYLSSVRTACLVFPLDMGGVGAGQRLLQGPIL